MNSKNDKLKEIHAHDIIIKLLNLGNKVQENLKFNILFFCKRGILESPNICFQLDTFALIFPALPFSRIGSHSQL